LVALLLPAVRAAREAARWSVCVNSFRQVSSCLSYFDSAYHRLPAAVRRDEDGRPLSSWRFQLEPFIEGIMIDVDYKERWDAPIQRWLATEPHWLFCWQTDLHSPERLQTNILAITGHGTAFDGDRPVRLGELPRDTILLIATANSGTHWMEPGDLDIDHVPESITQGLYGRGVLVLFADMAIWQLRRDVPLDELKKFFTIEGAKQHDRYQVLGPYAVYRFEQPNPNKA
jgi:hypothetical protein